MNGRLYISAGEKSGEQHASALVAQLIEQYPGMALSGMGGDILCEAGVDLFVDSSALAVTGFTEVIRHLGDFRRLLDDCTKHIEDFDPDAVILVDYPGFHMKLAEKLKKLNPDRKIFYYISPKFWAWNYRRMRKMKKFLDHVFCIFPFEPEMLRKEGIPATFVGNPLIDRIGFCSESTRKTVREKLGVDSGTPLISVFPGSRSSEVKRILPLWLEVIKLLDTRTVNPKVLIAAAPGYDKAKLESISGLKLDGIEVLQDSSEALMQASDLVLAKSGTTTLECALYGTPMIVVYRTSWLTSVIARRVARIKHFALPNLLTFDFNPDGEESGYEVVPEYFQEDAKPEIIAEKAVELLTQESSRDKMKAELLHIRGMLGGKGTSARAAELILDKIRNS